MNIIIYAIVERQCTHINYVVSMIGGAGFFLFIYEHKYTFTYFVFRLIINKPASMSSAGNVW